MEHIVQFGINIDDECIKNTILNNAEKNITKNIEKDIRNVMFGNYCENNSRFNELSKFTEELVTNFMEQHKDEIIKCAGEYLALRLIRTKKAKELKELID